MIPSSLYVAEQKECEHPSPILGKSTDEIADLVIQFQTNIPFDKALFDLQSQFKELQIKDTYEVLNAVYLSVASYSVKALSCVSSVRYIVFNQEVGLDVNAY